LHQPELTCLADASGHQEPNKTHTKQETNKTEQTDRQPKQKETNKTKRNSIFLYKNNTKLNFNSPEELQQPIVLGLEHPCQKKCLHEILKNNFLQTTTKIS